MKPDRNLLLAGTALLLAGSVYVGSNYPPQKQEETTTSSKPSQTPSLQPSEGKQDFNLPPQVLQAMKKTKECEEELEKRRQERLKDPYSRLCGNTGRKSKSG